MATSVLCLCNQIEFYLSEIDAWRSGAKATVGMPIDGRNYALCMRENIKRLDRKIIKIRGDTKCDSGT